MSISVSLKRVTAVAAAVAFVLSASAVTSASAATCNFTLNHKLGQTGGEIKSVQQFLNANGFAVAASGAGSAGMETSSFGGKTKAAVMAFQSAKGVSPVSGYWGPLTRAKANSACTGGTTGTTGGTTTTPAAGNAVVAAAPQPGNSLAVAGANRVPFTKFTVTAGATPVTLNSVVVERGGLATDAGFSGIILVDDMGNQVGFDKTLNSNHQATIGAPVVIPAGSTKTFTVAANISNAAVSGQVAVLSVVAVNASGTVAGSLPITGAQHTMNTTLNIGGISLSQGSQNPGAANKKVGDTNYIFSAIKLTADSTEDIRVRNIRFYQNGTASSTDLANVKVNFDGTDYPAVVSADGKYYSADLGSGVVITKGNSKEAFIKGDIISGSGRTVQFAVYDETDVFATGELYGYGAKYNAAGSGWNYTATPAFTGAPIATVGAGTLTISKDIAVGNNNVAKNVDGQQLGAFKVKAEGEPVNVRQMIFTIGGTHAQQVQLVKLVDSTGKTVAGPVDTVGNVATFSDSVTFPVGEKTYFLVGKADNAEVNGVTFVPSINTTTGIITPRGETSNQTAAVSGGALTLQTMTLKAGSLVIAMDSNPASQNVISGASSLLLARVKLDGGNSGEDVRVNNLKLATNVAAGGLVTHVTGCVAMDGATSLSSSVDAANPFTINFNSGVVVPKGTSKSVDIKCNLSSAAPANATYQLALTVPGDYTGTGVASTSTINPTLGTLVSGLMTAKTGGALTIALDTSVANNTVVSNSYDNVEADLGVVKLSGTVEDLTVRELNVALGAGVVAADIQTLKFYKGTTEVGSYSGTTYPAIVTMNGLTVPKDSSVQLTVKALVADIGVGKPGTNGNPVKVDVTGAVLNGNGTVSGSATLAGVKIYDSRPVVTVAESGAAKTLSPSSEMELARLTIAANAGSETAAEGDLVFNAGEQIVFTVSVGGFTPAAGAFSLKTDDGALNIACTYTAPSVTCPFAAGAGELRVGAGSSRVVKLVGNTTGATGPSNIQAKLDPVAANFSFTVNDGSTLTAGDTVFRGTILGPAFSKN